MTTIVHISDLHFGADHLFKSTDRDSLLTVLAKDIRQTVGQQPDCVVISGDLTTHGDPDGLKSAATFVKELAANLGVELNSFVIVPGNHEVDWPAVDNEKKRPTHTQDDLVRVGLANYKAFVVEAVFGRARDEFLTTFWSDGNVFVLGMNSCYFESRDNAGVGYINPAQLDLAEAEYKDRWERCHTRIAVLHHHLVPVTHANWRPDPRETSLTLNAPDILEWLAKHGFQIVLHGHQHQPFCATEVRRPYGREPYEVTVLGVGSVSARVDRLGPVRRNQYEIIQVTEGTARVLWRLGNSNAPNAFEDNRILDLPLKPVPPAVQLKVQGLGIQDFLWFNEIHWRDYFAKARDVEVYTLSGGELLRTHIDIVRNFVKRGGTKLSFLFYDVSDNDGLKLFDDHFEEPPNTRKGKLTTALNEIAKLRKDVAASSSIEVRFVRGPLKFRYSFYRFDDTYLYVPYKVQGLRTGAIPVLVLRAGEFLSRYILPDVEYLRMESKT